MMQDHDLGTPAWWQRVAAAGTPLLEACGEQYRVTFLWRDPQGDEPHSATRRVWLNITGRTDHHQPGPPQSLARIPGTDVWHWQTLIEGDWRGSYSLMPRTDEAVAEAGNGEPIRRFWRAVFPSAQADPLNPARGWQGQRGLQVSPLHMPEAPAQDAWQGVDRGTGPVLPMQRYLWHSERLGNSRPVWLLATGQRAPRERPLAILLDGAFWAHRMPVAAPLLALTEAGKLPEALYLLIDNIDSEHRSRELTCNPDFWLAVQQELLPQVRGWAEHSGEPARTLVAGQSFGGLSALYAALLWPERFGAALSQSGSFWWPRRDAAAADVAHGLLAQIEQGLGGDLPLRLYLEAGQREPLIYRVNQRLCQVLTERGQAVHWRSVNGGHDALCWRGGLLDGLQTLWADLAPGPVPTPPPFAE